MMRRFINSLLLIMLMQGCSPPADIAPDAGGLQLSKVLGGDDTAGFLRAADPRSFSFPEDHGLHPGFRNEWWYFTGNLETAEGRRFGYQLTFFTAAVAPHAEPSFTAAAPVTEAPPASAWRSERLWMAHLALTDVEAGVHYAVERFSRENPALAGAQAEPLRVWLEDWQLTQVDVDGSWRLQAADGELALDLLLVAQKAPVLQGENGLSRKSPEPGNASYYYSLTRLQTRGTVRTAGGEFSVSGSSWLDREWSTSALAADQSGWDWFSLQFNNGQELMYYQLRDAAGKVHPNSQGNWTDVDANQTLITPDRIALTELDHWTSPTGIRYTTAWSMALDGNAWQIRAVLPGQWMNLTIPYWEGAVDILDDEGSRVGSGYLEMVRQ
jgi:predicted secreted hydrolase